jgi:prevent-host-death family protein
MLRKITQRELRNESGDIMRALDAGESFLVTRNGVPVAQLTPVQRSMFTPKQRVIEISRNGPRVDYKQFRADVDALVDQSVEPRE